jgi:hypothetical protein
MPTSLAAVGVTELRRIFRSSGVRHYSVPTSSVPTKGEMTSSNWKGRGVRDSIESR